MEIATDKNGNILFIHITPRGVKYTPPIPEITYPIPVNRKTGTFLVLIKNFSYRTNYKIYELVMSDIFDTVDFIVSQKQPCVFWIEIGR